MSKSVYAFRGAPASGKSTLSPLVCEALPNPVALIEQDKFRWGIHTFNRDVLDITDEEHMLAYRVTVAAYEEYLRKGMHNVVIEGLFTYDDTASSQGNVIELQGLAEKYGYTFLSIVLRATKQELLARNACRDYSVPDVEYETLYNGVYAKVGDTEIPIDSTGQAPQETVRTILGNIGQK